MRFKISRVSFGFAWYDMYVGLFLSRYHAFYVVVLGFYMRVDFTVHSKRPYSFMGGPIVDIRVSTADFDKAGIDKLAEALRKEYRRGPVLPGNDEQPYDPSKLVEWGPWCPRCYGLGKVVGQPCPVCGGTGDRRERAYSNYQRDLDNSCADKPFIQAAGIKVDTDAGTIDKADPNGIAYIEHPHVCTDCGMRDTWCTDPHNCPHYEHKNQ